jgi:hypothetical protein
MPPPDRSDLGFGVHVCRGVDDEVIVTSPRLKLDWQTPTGNTPGTGVMVSGRPFEVVDRIRIRTGDRWVLRPWESASTMRVVVELDAVYVQNAERQARHEDRLRRRRWLTGVLHPVLGLAPAALQRRWADRWGLDAERATRWSAFLEIAWGGLGLTQLLALMLGGETFMPLVLAGPGPLLLVSGCVRLALVAADSEPVGSPLGLPLLLAVGSEAASRESATPTVRRFEPERGLLELASPVLRRDWQDGGTLYYHGTAYALETTDRQGTEWVYRFERTASDVAPAPQLRLLPPPETQSTPQHARSRPPPLLATVLVSAAVTLGPRSDQEVWAENLRLSPIWLTVVGGGAELIGGVVNLGGSSGGGAAVVLNAYLVGEGLLRLASAFGGRPIGSVFGWLLRPLYRRWLVPVGPHGGTD